MGHIRTRYVVVDEGTQRIPCVLYTWKIFSFKLLLGNFFFGIWYTRYTVCTFLHYTIASPTRWFFICTHFGLPPSKVYGSFKLLLGNFSFGIWYTRYTVCTFLHYNIPSPTMWFFICTHTSF